MNTERTVILENVSEGTIGLSDTQGRMYCLNAKGRIRISAVTLQDIFDCQGSKIIFKEGMAKVSNITKDELYNMGLTEEEINNYLLKEAKPAIVITEAKEEVEETIIPIEEESVIATEKAKKPTTKKSAKKTSKKA